MIFHRVARDADTRRDLQIRPAVRKRSKKLALARRQTFERIVIQQVDVDVRQRQAATRDRNDRFEQNLRHSLMWVISIGTNEIQRSLIAQL